jgi:hypothetical protein
LSQANLLMGITPKDRGSETNPDRPLPLLAGSEQPTSVEAVSSTLTGDLFQPSQWDRGTAARRQP